MDFVGFVFPHLPIFALGFVAALYLRLGEAPP